MDLLLDRAEDLALQARRRCPILALVTLWRGLCRRSQGAGLRGVVHLRPDQSAGAAHRRGHRARPVAGPYERRQPVHALPRPVGGRSRCWRAPSSSESARRALVDAGADPRYTVAPASEFGYSSPDRRDRRRRPDPGGSGGGPPSWSAGRSSANSTECSRQKAWTRGTGSQRNRSTPRTAQSCWPRASCGCWWPCSGSGRSCSSWPSRWPTR